MPDERIGDYTILGEAGRGGMGIVYHAHDESLDRDVAIKVLPDEVAANEKRMARFHREAKLLASLNHPNIASIYELGQDGDHPFVVMEFVDGPMLADRIHQGAMAWQDMVPIAIQIAEAMEYAHQHGVIHRDLKPQNVKFDSEGNVKVLDFGLAKAIESQEGDDVSDTPVADRATIQSLSRASHSVGSTMPGALLGTAGYLSPEQARGKDVDKQSDIFAFGCLMFEMLKGDAPFASDSAIDAIGMTLHKEPEWGSLPTGLPPRLVKLLRRCLAKEKRDRLHDIGDARIELAELDEERSDVEAVFAAPAASGSTRWKIACAVVTIGAIALAALYFTAAPPPPIHPEPAAGPLTNRAVSIPNHLRAGQFEAAADDSRIIIICANQVGEEDSGVEDLRFYARRRGSADLVEFHHFQKSVGMAMSPDSTLWAMNDGGRIAIGQTDRNLELVALAHIEDARRAVGPSDFFPACRDLIWFDEGTLIVQTVNADDAPGLALINANTGEIKQRLPIELPRVDLRLDGLIRRFDNEHVLMYVSQYRGTGFSIGVATISLKTGALNVLLDHAGDAQVAGDALFFSRGDSLFKAAFDPQTHTMLNSGRVVHSDLHCKFGAHGNFYITDTGTLVYKPGGMQADERRLLVNTGPGAQSAGLPVGPWDNFLSVSQDGSQLAVTKLRPDGSWEVWGGTTDPPRLRRLMSAPDMDFCFPLLSPDGSMLSCARVRMDGAGTEVDIVVRPTDGSSPAQVIYTRDETLGIQMLGFHPDNTRQLAGYPDDVYPGQAKLVEIAVADGAMTDLLSRPGGAYRGNWSPTGDLVAFLTNETGVPEVHVFDPASGEEVCVSHRPVNGHAWHMDNAGIVSVWFLDDSNQAWMVPVSRDTAGQIVLGEETSFPWVFSSDAFVYATDLTGQCWTIEPGVDDGPPNHLVVIENWLPSVVADDQ